MKKSTENISFLWTATVLTALLLLSASLLVDAKLAFAITQNPIEINEMDFELAKSLKKREAAVDEKEKELEAEKKELAALKKEVDEKLSKLVALQKEVKGHLSELKGVQDKQFKNLVKVYSTMSSSKAAPLLNRMDDPTVTKILRAMKSDLVAKIIPKLQPEKAVLVSKKLGMLNKIGSPK